jgi:competence ComEA-like helix-hairpin-helix protein
MRHAPALALAAGAGALLVATLLAATAPVVASAQQAPPPEPGDALVVRMCNECHDARTVTARRRTKTEWEASIRDMIMEGAEGTGKEFEAVFEYLLLTRGKVFINDARPEDIVQVLGTSKKDAEAIVTFRTEKGPFADLEALRKVPGIDLKLIDAQPDAIAF